MKRIALTTLVLGGLIAGCATYPPPAMRAQQAEDELIRQEHQRQLIGRIETLEMEVAQLNRELETQRQSSERRSAQLERTVQENKQQLIAQLSAQIEQLIQKATLAPKAPAPSAPSDYGFEHVVQPGETLSAIAKAYNVTTHAIIQANQLSNPNRLAVGQKLFIPE